MYGVIKILLFFFLISVSATPQYVSQFDELRHNSQSFQTTSQKSPTSNSTIIFKPSVYSFGGYDMSVRATLTYDKFGNVASEYWEDRVRLGYDDQITYTYDNKGRIMLKLREEKNGGLWQNKLKSTFEYNSIENKEIETEYSWVNGAWVTSRIITSVFNVNGNLLLLVSEEKIDGKITPYYQNFISYDLNSKIVSDGVAYWVDGNWKNNRRTLYSYNSSGNMDSKTEQKGAGTSWVDVSKYVHEYDQSGNQISTKSSIWNGNQWLNDSSWTRVFNSDGELVSAITSKWENNQYVVVGKKDCYYSGRGIMDSVIEFRRGTYYDITERIIYEYDEFGNTVSASASYLTPTGWRWTLSRLDFWFNNHTEKKSFTAASAEMEYAQLTITNGPGDIPATFQLEQNYPNPFSTGAVTGNSETTIRFALPKPGNAKGAVYDILGKEVAVLFDREIPAGVHEVKFDGKGLASGVYFFRINSGEYSSAIKMVVSR